MSAGILFVAATTFEVRGLLKDCEALSDTYFRNNDYDVLISGVGLMHSSFTLTQALYEHPEIKQIIHLGIAGDYNSDIPLGSIFQVTSASAGDLGVDKEAGFQSFYDDGLIKPDTFPYERALIRNYTLVNNKAVSSLPEAHAVTVNALSSLPEVNQSRKEHALKNCKEKHVLEHMECLTIFYIAMQMRKPFVSLLATSNRSGETNKDKWELKKAIATISETAHKILAEF